MTISNFCVGVVMFLCIMVVTFMFGWLVAFICDDDDMTTFCAWLTSSLCLAVCIIIIFVKNNII